MNFGGESGLRKLGLCGIHPLTQRYKQSNVSKEDDILTIKSSVKWIWKWTQNLVGWFGVGLACVSLYIQTIGRDHSLNISISSLEVRRDTLIIGVLYNNTGDYVETILNGELSLPTSDVSANAFNLENCFQPVTIKSKEAEHRYYTVQMPLRDEDKRGNAKINYDLEIEYRFILPDGAVLDQSQKIGSITYRELDGEIERAKISSNVMIIDFDKDGRTHLGEHFVPSSFEYLENSGCENVS